jgi:hypothetical protein
MLIGCCLTFVFPFSRFSDLPLYRRDRNSPTHTVETRVEHFRYAPWEHSSSQSLGMSGL